MVLQPRLDLRQAQTLVMTPQLQQAIKLLQLSNLELTAFVEQELERNPMLERDERPADSFEDRVPAEERRDATASVLVEAVGGTSAPESPLDVEVDNSYDEGSPYEGPSYDPDTSLGSWEGAGSGGRSDFGDDDRAFDETLSSPVSLRDHLVGQLELDIADPRDRMVGMALIDALDDAGWLTTDLDDIADGLGTTRAHVETVLAKVQTFDPAGLFARSLKECLALQLADRNRLDPAMQTLLDHLEMLARRDFPGLLRLCRVDAEDLQDMIAEIRVLDPKPAVRFGGGAAEPVVPDVLVRSGPGGEHDGDVGGAWIIELNPDTLPRVLLNNRYYARISRAASREDRSFITESFQTASWLVKALDQRANTILKVSTEIIRQQNRFLEIGVSGLRPLILRDIAEAVDLHESTVSRVTSNKYISTPRGVFELKYFFTQAINAADGGDAHSAEAVRHRIRTLIDAESPTAVLSDDTLVDILRKEGIDIARRTVAKYREGMKIPSSVQRRREKSVKGLVKTR